MVLKPHYLKFSEVVAEVPVKNQLGAALCSTSDPWMRLTALAGQGGKLKLYMISQKENLSICFILLDNPSLEMHKEA